MKKAFFLYMRKQRRSNCEADQHLCFRNKIRTIHLLPKFEDRFSHDEAQLW